MLGKLLKERYQVIDTLNAGGFCQTYLAKDVSIAGSPSCVIKQLKSTPNFANYLPTLGELLDREAEALKKLGFYDRVPQLLAHFEEDDEFYLVQELIVGHPLTEELSPKEHWSETQVTELLQEVLSILEYVHSQGLIHRDIKPSNLIRRQEDGKLVLIDFGAVKQAWTQVITTGGKTATNYAFGVAATIAIGTPGYTPPEQERGIPRPNSDIYALGTIAIQALTGLDPTQIPEDPETGELLWQHHAQVSDRLATIINKMVRYHFKERYASATEVLQALQVQLPPSPPIQISAPAKTNKKNIPILPFVGVGLTISLIVGSYYYYLFKSPPKPAASTKQYNYLFKQPSNISNITLAKTLKNHSQPVWATSISDNGQVLASGSQDRTIKVWNVRTGQLQRTLLGHKDTVRSLAMSAEGRTLASGSGDTTIKLWDLSQGKLIGTFSGHSSPVWSVDFAPDGKTLISASEDGSINIWNLRTGATKTIESAHNSRIFSIAVSPDNQTFATGSKDKTIKLWQLPTGKLLRTINEHKDAVRAIAYSPDGTQLASGSWDTTIHIWHPQTGKRLQTLQGHSDRIVSLVFSNDGQQLASSGIEPTIKLWDTKSGKLLRKLTGHSDWVLSLATVPGSNRLISSSKDKTIKIWH
ncbi:serine/threonine-protein kinase [Synechocystis sp. PCC 7509]|uniref:serine/threonine-protein kinase n=1 Tax=Synechocystis sp. PCC 7509 TaxID=927677 RepID=UPI0002AD1277|nr:serine/threonine-protein kinase [Synechocystis sp. PCC 7509]